MADSKKPPEKLDPGDTPEQESPSNFAQYFPSKTIDKLYDDALSGSAKELGKILTSTTKVARLLTYPIQRMAAFQDRLDEMNARIETRVPDERLIEAQPQIVGPCLESMRYLDDKSLLWKMFEEVITKSVDSESANLIHPAFPLIIPHLSRDEAWILYRLKARNYIMATTIESFTNESGKTQARNHKIESFDFPVNELHFPDKIRFYTAHLETLNLTTWPVVKDEITKREGDAIGSRFHSELRLTEFGRLFAAAGIRDDGFLQTDET